MTTLTWTLSFLRPYRGRVVAVVGLTLLEIGLAALAPWPLKLIVDSVFGTVSLPAALTPLLPSWVVSSGIALLVVIVGVGFLIQLGNEVVRMIHTQLQVDTAQRIVYKLRADLLTHLQALPLGHHIATKTADGVYRLDADAHCVDDLVIGGFFPLTLAALNLTVMFAVLVYLDPVLAMLSVAVAPFLYLSLRRYSHAVADRAEHVKALESTVIERAFEVLSTIAAVKSFAREHHEVARFRHVGDQTMRARLALTWQESLFSVTVTAITLAGTSLVFVVGGLHVLEGTLTVGGLLVVAAYLAAVYDPVSEIARTAGSLQQAAVSARRVREIFALTPEPIDPPTAGSKTSDRATSLPSTIRGAVRFDNVGFFYHVERPVLDGVSFEAHPGEMVALVGLTGAGKTTIANLIPRLFEPTSGRILIDGHELSRYPLKALREQIALVPQQPVLFADTIAQNIRYGRLDATDADVMTAARDAHVHDFIERLRQGYDTQVAEAGATLSGGERQRLGIARALVKDAPILILDEPTSALDSLSETAVFDALRRLRVGRTTLVIAHRLSTIRDATRILVLDHGHLVAQGPHDELMQTSALYRQMCARLSVGQSLDEPETADDSRQDTMDDSVDDMVTAP